MKKFVLCFILCAAWPWAPPIALSAPTAPKCFWTDDMGQAICAPPFGDIIQDVNTGRYLCGLGQCVITSNGRFRCSSVVGGAAMINTRNRAACVGGCQDAVESLCVMPRP